MGEKKPKSKKTKGKDGTKHFFGHVIMSWLKDCFFLKGSGELSYASSASHRENCRMKPTFQGKNFVLTSAVVY